MGETAATLRLKDTHPTAIKIAKLVDLAMELKISISFYGHRVIIDDEDRDPNLPHLMMEDIEPDNLIQEFPPTTEYKLVYDNPVYLAERRKEHEDYIALQSEKNKEAKAKAAADKKAYEDKIALAKETQERETLAKLKAKYE
jgi:hypothetical protein